MRLKQLRLVLTFPSTTAALGWEDFCLRRELPGRLVPLPASISASCGLCWSAPPQERQRLEMALCELSLEGTAMYELEM